MRPFCVKIQLDRSRNVQEPKDPSCLPTDRPKPVKITIKTPADFSFRRTIFSHGWYGLQPFHINETRQQLTRVLDLTHGKPVTVTMRGLRNAVEVTTTRTVGKRGEQQIVKDVRHMLRLDDDLSLFYGLIAADPEFGWIRTQGAGRLLRSPTVFEDLVKMICTTNCSWALTQKMVTGLVESIGRESDDGRRAFPTSAAMAQMPLKFYVNEVRAGYRAPYFKELADRVASGELDVEAWLSSSLPTAELMKEMRGVKGVGPYAAENVLKLIGRYDGLALDSWTRAKFFTVRNSGRKANDKKIARFYSRFGEWRGLALWCDMTHDWLDG
jgi:3-methyladenine DNA glycosylase/8-oxoguanine DNA glycosylase